MRVTYLFSDWMILLSGTPCSTGSIRRKEITGENAIQPGMKCIPNIILFVHLFSF
jgi:hypothetical protein